jgi:uncharacterized protein YnzC (UPF0291/DUF896 family)
MLVFVIILLSICLIASIVTIILLYKAGVRQLSINEILEEDNQLLKEWISEFRVDVLKTFSHMKLLDDKQMFEKDDEVGILYQDISDLIKNLNNKIEEEPESIISEKNEFWKVDSENKENASVIYKS